ncbi:hypothetical protein ACIBG8_25255 [Nonomuraea sp. NPDC050556]|uniref:hypothetical protein n=1 Tax=Nonomuraea sp. NPDC050556 TaxID=3364369 RepID=UPI0037903E3B
MPYSRLGGIQTISGNTTVYYEYWYNSGSYNCHPYLGPTVVTPEIYNDYPDCYHHLVSNNHGVITKRTCQDPNTFTDIDLYYTVTIANESSGSCRFFFTVGRF